jgi:hypothetical protein
MRIHADPDPDPNLKNMKIVSYMKASKWISLLTRCLYNSTNASFNDRVSRRLYDERFFVHDTGTDVIHYCCMDVVGWKRLEVGLKRACRVTVVGVCGF